MSVLKCVNCDSELTKDMIEAGMCFNCGEQLSSEILASSLARNVLRGSADKKSAQYKIIDGNIYCIYCESLLDESTLETSLCPNCGEYFILDEIEQVVKERILVQKAELEKKKADEEAAREAAEILETEEEIRNYLHIRKYMTTGYSFEGFKIKEYKSIVSAQSIIGTGPAAEFSASIADFFGEESAAFSKKIDKVKDTAVERLIRRTLRLDANAIIGVNFDYITFANNMLGVVVNGTAVVIDRVDEDI